MDWSGSVKVTSEKLPASRVALDIELDQPLVEKGLDRAARRLSQKYTIPGFRKGKAPRFIVENYVGRAALVDDAVEDIVNEAFRAAIKQEGLEPLAPGSIEEVNFDEQPFRVRVTIPVAPTTTIPDHRAIRVTYEAEEVTDEVVEQAMEARRERHVVLRELEEPRPAQAGDQLTVQLDAFLDGKLLDEREPDAEAEPSEMVLDEKRLAPGLFDVLVGANVDDVVETDSHLPDDHPNEKVRDRDVRFVVKINNIQERLLPEWDELPTLEEFEGTIDELREKTCTELEASSKLNAERSVVNNFIDQLVKGSSFDIPDVLIEQEADALLQQQESEYTRYGVTPEQIYEMQGRRREDLIDELRPQGEERLKTTLALSEVVRSEQIQISDAEVDAEAETMLQAYPEDRRDQVRPLLLNQMRSTVANSVLDKKLRVVIVGIASGDAPAVTPTTDDAADDTTPVATPAADVAEQTD